MDFFELLQTAGWIVAIVWIALLILVIKLIMAVFRIRDALESIDETTKEIAKNQDIIISTLKETNSH